MSSKAFKAEDHRPSAPDGKFRVVLVTSGSVASVKLPLIAAELIKVGPTAGQRPAIKSARRDRKREGADLRRLARWKCK
jgi:phosphopantothenoylcysteine decarboxylase